MAKLPALVRAFAKFDERDERTIEQFARVIREAGELPTTKRGVGAAEMGAKEAAKLFIALNGSDGPKGAVKAIQDFYYLPLKNSPQFYSSLDDDDDQPPADGVEEVISTVIKGAEFGEALANLFETIPILLSFMDQKLGIDCRKWMQSHIVVTMHRPTMRAEITVNLVKIRALTAAMYYKKYDRSFRHTDVYSHTYALYEISRLIAPENWSNNLVEKIFGPYE